MTSPIKVRTTIVSGTLNPETGEIVKDEPSSDSFPPSNSSLSGL